MNTKLAKYEAARQALATAANVDEVKEIRNEAIALATYAHQAKDTEMIEYATSIKLRAERRLGEMMAQQPKAKGGQPYQGKSTGLPENPVDQPASLAQAGIDKNLANRARRAAELTEDQFEERVVEAKKKASASVKIGSPKKPKKPKSTRKPDEVQIQASINVRPHEWDRFKEQAEEEGTSAAAKLGAMVADPEIDPKSLSASAQEKLEVAIRQEKRKLQAEFEQAVQDAANSEVKRALNDMVLPQYNKRLAEYHQVIKARKGVMTRATYRMILSWLHPDRVSDPAQKEGITKAFHAFTNMELALCNEKEMPTSPVSVPRTHEEWVKRRAEMKAKPKKQSNSVQQRT